MIRSSMRFRWTAVSSASSGSSSTWSTDIARRSGASVTDIGDLHAYLPPRGVGLRDQVELAGTFESSLLTAWSMKRVHMRCVVGIGKLFLLCLLSTAVVSPIP